MAASAYQTRYYKNRFQELKSKGICTRCMVKPALANNTQCEPCRDGFRVYSKQRHIRLTTNRQCVTCTSVLEPTDKTRCATCYAKYDGKVYNRRLKEEVFQHYGQGRCTCCGESELMFLQMDHMNNDGARERRELGVGGSNKFYRWLKQQGFPPGYQILCGNCNMGKHLNGGTCPHQSQKALAA